MAPAMQQDPALLAPTVCIGRPPAGAASRDFQGIPGVGCTPGGGLWATWYGGGQGEGPDNDVMLARRDPVTGLWSEPDLFVHHEHPQVRTFDPTLWTDPLGRLWLFWAQGHSPELHKIWDGRAGVWGICCDEPDAHPQQWSEPHRLCDGIMMNKPTLDDRGRWLLPVTIWQMKPHHPAIEAHQRGPRVAISEDQGRSAHLSVPAHIDHPMYDEHHVLALPDGRWSLWARTAHPQAKAAVCYSHDQGQSWTPGVPCSIPCPNSRFHLSQLPSGTWLLVSHDTAPGASLPVRSHLTAWLSQDQGQSWQYPLLIDDRQAVSYPDMAPGPDGRLHIIYDRDRYGDREILLASLTEDDIRQGNTRAIERQTISRLG